MSDVTADSSETPAGTTDATMVADLTAAPEAAADVPPELVAQSLGQYLRASWARVRGGNSGVLPVVLAIVVVAVGFRSRTQSSCRRRSWSTSSSRAP